MQYSVIIPTLNEEDTISACIESVRSQSQESEIIVVDGGSRDQTCRVAEQLGVRVIHCIANRGLQLNTGATQSSGDVMVFLHGDTCLPGDALDLIGRRFADESAKIGTFRLAFDRKQWLLKTYAWFTRFDSVFTSFGDQCIVVKRGLFNDLGGFLEWKVFDDVEFLRKARKKERIYSFPAEVITSARRFVKNGLMRQQLRNALYMVLFFTGADPEELATRYGQVRGQSGQTGLIIFAKYPKPGHVKTRLASSIGRRDATQFYSLCAQRIFLECRRLLFDSYVFFANSNNKARVRAWVGSGPSLIAQVGDDLGARMTNAFNLVYKNGASKAIIIGTDVPDLSAKIIIKAEELLTRHDMVIGPSRDGGYYLLGLKRMNPELFKNIQWSTSSVFKATMEKAFSMGMSVAELAVLADIDTREELFEWTKKVREPDNHPIAVFARNIGAKLQGAEV